MATTRTRSRDNRKMETREWGFADGTISTTDTDFSGSLETIQDVNHPNFRQCQREGVIVLGDCSITRWERVVTPGSMHRGISPASGLMSDSGDLIHTLAGQGPLPVLEASLDNSNVLLVKAYAKMNSSSVLGGEILGTLGQTISMIRSPLKSSMELLTKMGKARNRRLGKTAASAAKATADTWLEYRYGWTPLLLDMEKVISDSLAIRRKTDRQRFVARAGDSAEINTSHSWSGTALNYWCSGDYTLKKKLRCNVGVIYEALNRTPTSQIGSYFGLTARDVVPTLWELVPYSFVADWFTNVGDVLQAISPNPDVVVRHHWATFVSESSFARGGSRNDPYEKWSGTLGREVINEFTFQRVIDQEVTFIPEFTGTLLSTLQQADAAALLVAPITKALSSWRH